MQSVNNMKFSFRTGALLFTLVVVVLLHSVPNLQNEFLLFLHKIMANETFSLFMNNIARSKVIMQCLQGVLLLTAGIFVASCIGWGCFFIMAPFTRSEDGIFNVTNTEFSPLKYDQALSETGKANKKRFLFFSRLLVGSLLAMVTLSLFLGYLNILLK